MHFIGIHAGCEATEAATMTEQEKTNSNKWPCQIRSALRGMSHNVQQQQPQITVIAPLALRYACFHEESTSCFTQMADPQTYHLPPST